MSPLLLLTRSSHETLNAVHQLLGRVVTLLLYLHAALYLNFYIVKGLLAAKLQEAYVVCGVVGIVAFTVVGATALGPLRRRNYRLYYIVHVTLATIVLPALWFHVSHIRIYLYETAAVYIIHLLLRASTSKTLQGTIKVIPESNIVEISLPLPESQSQRYRAQSRWHPGQHAYVSLPGHALLRTFRSNPFTVASIPSVDRKLKFIARILDGNTAKLATSAATQHNGTITERLTVEGPYGAATHADRLLRYDRVLLVAGGVGATFIVPLYRQFLADLSPSKGSYRRQKVTFIWTARTRAEVAWGIPADVREREGFMERLRIYTTGVSSTSNGSYDVVGEGHLNAIPDGIELQERTGLLPEIDDAEKDAGILAVKVGRPDLKDIINQACSHSSRESVAVVCCGPRSLGDALRQHVSRFVNMDRDVWFWQESFAL